VALGIGLAAVVMLVAFLPPLVRHQRHSRATAEPAAQAPVSTINVRPAWALTLSALAIAVVVLVVRLPSVDYTTDRLGPKNSHARETIVEIEEEILGEDDPLWLIVRGGDEGEVAASLERSRDLLDRAVEEGLVTEHALPDALWPRPEAQRANRQTIRRLLALHGPARAAAIHAGFASDGLELTDRVFAAWERFAGQETVQWPSRPASQWAFRKFAARSPEQLIALGRLDAAEDASSAALLGLDGDLESADAGRLFGWPLLSESLLGIMQRDIQRVLLPLAVVLILAMGLAFRRVGEIGLSFAALGFSLLCLLALTSMLGWSWNLMNLMALPLLFGAGIDYSIHIQLALRRSGGDVRLVRRTVGRAILLCGASTATGFGTLAFASNAGVASLGRVCAAGILIAGFTSIVLLPMWWLSWKRYTWKKSQA
jgi:predicted RND superfamily exporter protein